MMKISIESKSFPITCPEEDCKTPFSESDIRNRVEPDIFQKYISFTLKDFFEKNNQVFLQCPTPDCKFVFSWEGNKKD